MPLSFRSIQNYFSSFLISPIPHNSLEVYHTLLTLYRIHLINLFLSLPAFLLHTAVLTFSFVREEACDKPFGVWLIVISSITAIRVVPQCILITKTSYLLSEWVNRPVAYETSLLVKSVVAQLDRILWIISLIWYFVGFQWAYQSVTCNLIAPILYQYVSILILFFLAMMGLNCLMCMGSSTIIFLACVIPTDRFTQLFEDRRSTSNPIPLDILKKMDLIEWTPDLENETDISKMCTICLGEYETGQYVRKLACGHCFHQVCIDQWFQTNSSCPLRCHVDLISGKNMEDTPPEDQPERHSDHNSVVIIGSDAHTSIQHINSFYISTIFDSTPSNGAFVDPIYTVNTTSQQRIHSENNT